MNQKDANESKINMFVSKKESKNTKAVVVFCATNYA